MNIIKNPKIESVREIESARDLILEINKALVKDQKVYAAAKKKNLIWMPKPTENKIKFTPNMYRLARE